MATLKPDGVFMLVVVVWLDDISSSRNLKTSGSVAHYIAEYMYVGNTIVTRGNLIMHVQIEPIPWRMII